MRRLNIRLRIAFWNTIAFAVILTFFSTLVFFLLKRTHYTSIDEKISKHIQIVEQSIRGNGKNEVPSSTLNNIVIKSPEAFWVLRNSQGHIIFQSEELPKTRFLGHHTDNENSSRNFQFKNKPFRVRSTKIVIDKQEFRLTVLFPMDQTNQELNQVLAVLIITIPSTLFLTAFLAYLLAVKALQPINDLGRQTNEISEEQIHRRIPVLNPTDEIGRLTVTINDMISRLEESFQKIKQFTSDASHEFKTPIAVICSEAELGITFSENNSQAKEKFQSILEECELLSRTTDQLLTISTADQTSNIPKFDHVDVVLLLNEVLSTMTPLAKENEIHLSLKEIDPELNLKSNSLYLKQITRILIDNAIKYGKPNGIVDVSCCKVGKHVEISIQDNGVGIAQKDLPLVFDRFFRVSGRSISGTGLGLSIASKLVSRLGGQIEVKSEINVGSNFLVRLPLI